MEKIGFIGIGVMGSKMVSNLLKANYTVKVYNRTKSKANSVVKEGAIWCDTIKECVENSDVVITIVGYPKDVEEVYFSDFGIIKSAKEGTILIDMTTTDPEIAKKIYQQSKAKGLEALDAPVSGGDTGARNKTLSIMVGGDEKIFKECYNIFESLGKTIVYQGSAGSGQNCKLANQIAIAGCVAGVAEAIAFAKKKNLSIDKVFQSISKGAAGSSQMTNNGPKMATYDFEPGFYIKHFIKDMNLAKDASRNEALTLDILEKVLKIYQDLEKNGNGNLGTQAIIKHYN